MLYIYKQNTYVSNIFRYILKCVFRHLGVASADMKVDMEAKYEDRQRPGCSADCSGAVAWKHPSK